MVFDLVDRPEREFVLPLKWVLSYKIGVDGRGYLDKAKTIICARGDI